MVHIKSTMVLQRIRETEHNEKILFHFWSPDKPKRLLRSISRQASETVADEYA